MPAWERGRAGRFAVVGLGCFAALWAIGFALHAYGGTSLAVNQAAVRAWLAGGALYDSRLGAGLPPVTALLMTPGAALPWTVTAWLLAVSGMAALVLSLVALAGPIARRYGRSRFVVVVAAALLALTAEPVRSALGLGHLDLVLLGLITADVVALRRSAWARRRAAWWPSASRSSASRLHRIWTTGSWAGVGIGLATALAVGPGLFIVYLAVTRQWRAVVTATTTALTLVLGGFLVAPNATERWIGTVLFQVDRSGPVGDPANQSLAGLLARLYDSTSTPVLVWLSFAVLLLAVGLIRARAAHAEGDEIAAFTLVGLAGAAAAPVSASHKLVWVLPAMLILVDAAARSRAGARRPGRRHRWAGVGYAAAALVTYLLFALPPQWTLDWNAYAFAVIVLMNALPWRPAAVPEMPPGRRPVVPPQVPPRVPAIPGPRGS